MNTDDIDAVMVALVRAAHKDAHATGEDPDVVLERLLDRPGASGDSIADVMEVLRDKVSLQSERMSMMMESAEKLHARFSEITVENDRLRRENDELRAEVDRLRRQ